jgi:hypothetical protein
MATTTPVGAGLTLADVTDWLDRLTRDGPGYVIDSGAYGIQVVGSQGQDLYETLEDLAGIQPAAEETVDLGVAETFSADWDPIRKTIEWWAGLDDLKILIPAILNGADGIRELSPRRADLSAEALTGMVPPAIPLAESRSARRNLRNVRDFIHSFVDDGGGSAPAIHILSFVIGGSDGKALAALNEIQQLKLKIRNNTVYPRRKGKAYVVGGTTISSGGPSDPLERQVARALSGALNRSAPTTADGLVRALRETYPIARGGAASALRPGVERPSGTSASTDAFSGTYPPRQAVLVRQAAVIAADLLSIVATLQPTTVTADVERFQDARRAVEAEVKALLDEFKYRGGPREQLALGYFEALRGDRDPKDLTFLPTRGHIGELIGAASRVRRPETFAEERFEASVTVVARYSGALRTAYEQYRQTSRRSIGEITSDALELLPILGETNRAWQNAMDRAGVSASERQLIDVTEPSAAVDRLLEDDRVTAEIDDLLVQLEQLGELQAEVNQLSLSGTGSR